MLLLDGKPVGKRFGMAIVAAAGYEMMKVLYDRRIFPNIEGLRNVVNLLGRSNEQIRRIKVERHYRQPGGEKVGERRALLKTGIVEWWGNGF
jgi:hypothetical protein